MIEGGPLITMVAPCSPPSRTLRAGFAGAASGILDGVCARRSAARQVGTKGWFLAAEQRDGAHSHRSRARGQERTACYDFVLDKKAPIQGGAKPRTRANHPKSVSALSSRARGIA